VSLAADSPSPCMSSLSEDYDDFAEILAAELDLASAADSASQGDPSASPANDDEEEQDVAVEGDRRRRAGQVRHLISPARPTPYQIVGLRSLGCAIRSLYSTLSYCWVMASM
jgi:hypothetical protein